MNLKNAILSTISEIEQTNESFTNTSNALKPPFNIKEIKPLDSQDIQPKRTQTFSKSLHSDTSPVLEEQFLLNLRERILVLFEGFQSPNNVSLESKIDLTLNFLEHLLAKIDHEIESTIKKK